jgi:hypothetical protein
VPLLYTPSFVVEKLQGGADLMTPGLQRGPPFPKKATKGAVVAVASLEAPSVPMAVGTCVIDVSALDKVQGMKGHAVQTFHWAGDELWSWTSSSKPGTDAPDYIEGWDEEKQEDSTLASQAAATRLEDDDAGGVALNSDPTERSAAEKAQGVEGEDPPSIKDSFELVDDKELSQKGRVRDKICSMSADLAKKSTTLSGTLSSMVCAIIWSTTRTTLRMASSSLFRSPKSCLSSFNPSFPPTRPPGRLHSR